MIECVPNFSEGRRQEVIDAIAAAITSVPGAPVIDIHADADHHRSVITFAGSPEAVAEAAFRAVRQAAELIDMTRHRGEHPRIGATDVLPFVPLHGATLDQCVTLARAVGQRIGDELTIPVYLYGAAALRPDRLELPALRRGEYEGLHDTIATDPGRAPDFGPARLGSAGAVAVGARAALIAYNLYLSTDDVTIAKRIARSIRASSGGLRGVRALGMLVQGRAQVSMNLTDYRTTPAHRVVEMVEREAARYGVQVTTGELVGLVPADALFGAGCATLRLHDFSDDQVLERRLEQALGVPIWYEHTGDDSWRLTLEALREATLVAAAAADAPRGADLAQAAHNLNGDARSFQATAALADSIAMTLRDTGAIQDNPALAQQAQLATRLAELVADQARLRAGFIQSS